MGGRWGKQSDGDGESNTYVCPQFLGNTFLATYRVDGPNLRVGLGGFVVEALLRAGADGAFGRAFVIGEFTITANLNALVQVISTAIVGDRKVGDLPGGILRGK